MQEVAARLNALGVDPSTDSRMRLKQAMGAVVLFKEVLLYANINEAASKLTNSVIPFDVIFVSERFPHDVALAFVKESKAKLVSQDSAYITLIGDNSDKARDAIAVLEGFDGCLREPYSVDALVDMTTLATEVKRKRQNERQLEAITFIVKDIIKRLDRLAYIKQCQANTSLTLTKFKKACKVFQTFEPEVLSRYFEIASDLFAETAPYASLSSVVGYHGVSERIKKKMIEKLVALDQAD